MAIGGVLSGLRALVRRDRAEQELDAELQQFLDAAVEAKISRGMSRETAVRAARLELGGVEAVKDRVRDVWWESALLRSIGQDIDYAIRMMRRLPGLTAVILLTLALSVGANTAIFTLLNAVLLRPLAVPEPDRLVEVLTRYEREPVSGLQWKYFEYLRQNNHVFSDLLAVSLSRLRIDRDGVESETVDGAFVSASTFSTLRLAPVAGRVFDARDAQPNAPAVAVLSWSYWKRLGFDPSIVGQRLVVQDVPATVVGVVSPSFTGFQTGSATDIWLPIDVRLAQGGGEQTADGQPWVQAIGQLEPGVSLARARAEVEVLDRWRRDDLAKTKPDLERSRLELRSAATGVSALRDRFSTPLVVVMAIVGLLLLIACANVASLLLARSAARARELAIRAAIGARRGRIVRQVLTESLLLSAIGSATGLLVAVVLTKAIARMLASGRPMVGMPGGLNLDVSPDGRVLLFTLAIAGVTGILFGVFPAWSAYSAAPARSLSDVGRIGDPPSRRRFGSSLVVAQIALSVVALSAAATCVNYLSNLRSRDLGFERDRVTIFTLDPAGSGYEREQLAHLYRDLLARLEALPGVRSATLSGVTPIEGPGAGRAVTVEGGDAAPTGASGFLSLNWVAPRYFETFGTPLIAGRDFTFEEESGPRAVIVNQAMVRRYLAGRDPLGQHLTFEGQRGRYEIVGVVADTKYSDLHEAPPPMAYFNAIQEGRGRFSQFAVKTAGSNVSGADIRRVVRDVLKSVPVARVTTLSSQIDASIVPERLTATLSGLFAALGALLAAIGLYGLLAFTVARRTPEIGMRVALGASRGHITALVLKSALTTAGLGVAVGVPLAWWGRSLIARFVAEVPVQGVGPTLVAAAAMLLVALVAAYVPVRRAARLTAAEALR